MKDLKLKEVVYNSKKTVPEIAKNFGVSTETIYRQINGNPTVSTLKKYSEFLNIPISQMFSDFEQKTEPEKENIICPHCKKPIQIKIEPA